MHYPRLIKFEVLWVFNSFKTLLELSLSAEFWMWQANAR